MPNKAKHVMSPVIVTPSGEEGHRLNSLWLIDLQTCCHQNTTLSNYKRKNVCGDICLSHISLD